MIILDSLGLGLRAGDIQVFEDILGLAMAHGAPLSLPNFVDVTQSRRAAAL